VEDLRKRVADLEAQLEEANTVTLGKTVPLLLRKLGYPILIVAFLILFIVFKRDIAAFFGIGYKDTEEARVHNANAACLLNRVICNPLQTRWNWPWKVIRNIRMPGATRQLLLFFRVTLTMP